MDLQDDFCMHFLGPFSSPSLINSSALWKKSGPIQRLPGIINNRLNEFLNGLKLARIHLSAHGDPRNRASFLTAKCVSF